MKNVKIEVAIKVVQGEEYGFREALDTAAQRLSDVADAELEKLETEKAKKAAEAL